jgi:predicted flap endonuclease-1-like 5' DNA nuclease
MAARMDAAPAPSPELIDPVYEGKSMHGMCDLIRKGEIGPDSMVLYVHLGGAGDQRLLGAVPRLSHGPGARPGTYGAPMDNVRIAERLETFAALLELADANPYQARAYRRAAETVRAAPVPVADLVRADRIRGLRGIGAGIEARLRELVETGAIAELAALERELAPDLVGLGRYLGLGAQRSVELARALGVRTADELRPPPADCGQSRASAPRPRPGCSRRWRASAIPARAKGCC